MKTILVIVGIGTFVAPAVAGNSKPHRAPAKPITLASAARPAAAPAAPATATPSASATDTTGVLDIPVLPPDSSSVLQPLPELERRAVVVTAAPAKASKAKAPVINLGQDYVLGGRRAAAKPDREVEQIIPKSLSQAQVATVVQSHMADIQNCWDLVPKAQRTDACTAMLRLSISDAGAVTDVELGGDVPAGAQTCITSAVARWTFPVAETRSDVEYGISLRSL